MGRCHLTRNQVFLRSLGLWQGSQVHQGSHNQAFSRDKVRNNKVFRHRWVLRPASQGSRPSLLVR